MFDVSDDLFDAFIQVIREMDNGYLEWRAKKAKIKSGKYNGK